MKRPRRIASSLSESVHHQLNMYALAASAAGVSLLALVQPGEAKIVYHRVHYVISPNHSYHLDLNHDGIADFEIKNRTFTTDTIVATLVALPAQPHNRVVGAQTHIGVSYVPAYALRRGANVGPKQPFAGTLMAGSIYLAGTWGRWINVSSRYLGLRFSVKGKIHYGWARLNVSVHHARITATLTGYAYETIPNKPIITGKTRGRDEVDPDATAAATSPAKTTKPATLGVLATGTPGLSIWRRKESALEPELEGGL
jgi:hypothetical protein